MSVDARLGPSRDAGSIPAASTISALMKAGSGDTKLGQLLSQVGQPPRDTKDQHVKCVTGVFPTDTKAGQKESQTTAKRAKDRNRVNGDFPPDLAALIDMWPSLSNEVRALILTIVENTKKGSKS